MTAGERTSGPPRPDEEEKLRRVAAEWKRRQLPFGSGDEPDTSASARSWSRLRERLLAEGLLEVPPVPRRQRRVVPLWSAAALVLLLAGAVGLILRLEGRILRLEEPRVNAAVHDLVPAGERLRGQGWQRISIPDDAPAVVLHLNLDEVVDFESYEIEIRSCDPSANVPSWRLPVAQSTAVMNFNVVLSRGALSGDCYRITLRGESAGELHLVAEYPVRVVHP
jgi:hypothetical protein